MPENKKSSMRFIVLLTVFVIGLVAVFVVLDNREKSSETTSSDSAEEAPSTEEQPTIGEEGAPVEIIEFGDYKCPACKVWSDQVYPQLKEDYIDKGDVSLTYINTLFHGQESELGARAGEAVYNQGEEAFWEFNKSLFEEQPEENHDAEWITDEKLLEVAENSVPSLDSEQFEEDLTSSQVEEAVAMDDDLVVEHKIEQTPTLMINGEVLEDPFDYDAISSLINEELEGNDE
ncbi:DsbA family protein [Halobacillus sp. A5]|uniref:DsbA family protein n=1 Tax=Halobacillus sp. A5 TaxID=2880263 RepID=UPI0020A63DAB|nr:DsbA family protein [Halobacillus sp. A5]MCP3028800.1 DsbA family protein [Halobacillus sp. A5]